MVAVVEAAEGVGAVSEGGDGEKVLSRLHLIDGKAVGRESDPTFVLAIQSNLDNRAAELGSFDLKAAGFVYGNGNLIGEVSAIERKALGTDISEGQPGYRLGDHCGLTGCADTEIAQKLKCFHIKFIVVRHLKFQDILPGF